MRARKFVSRSFTQNNGPAGDVAFSPVAQVAVAMLLIMGMYLPSSTHGEHSRACVFMLLAILLSSLGYLTWNLGVRPGAATWISLPIVIVLLGCTLVAAFNGPSDCDFGTFVRFSALAMVLSLDLRSFRSGRLINYAFVAANCINIACGVAIVAGNEWIGRILSAFYSEFYPELVPSMISLHKPVLTFGTHSLAGFFVYLFFWLNWETYKFRRSALALSFAMCELVLLLALTSFTSLAFAMLALVQMGVWLWKNNRKVFAAAAVCIALLMPAVGQWFEDNSGISEVLPQLKGTILNSDVNGLLPRYGPGGALRAPLSYLFHHPMSPIGFLNPSVVVAGDTALSDSGPVEYVLRGSIPLLVLVYFGLYKFLRFNLPLGYHALFLFFVIVTFEIGFSSLIYFRTLYLLPFFVIYLRYVTSEYSLQAGQGNLVLRSGAGNLA